MSGRLSQGQIIAAVGAVVLVIATFLPWAGAGGSTPSLPSGVNLPPGVSVPSAASTTVDVWEITASPLDVFLILTAIVAALPALLALTDASEEFSFVSAATFVLGIAAVIQILAFMTVDFPAAGETKYGCWIGLAAGIIITFGGFRAMQEEVAGEI
jgi:hypothetical protein